MVGPGGNVTDARDRIGVPCQARSRSSVQRVARMQQQDWVVLALVVVLMPAIEGLQGENPQSFPLISPLSCSGASLEWTLVLACVCVICNFVICLSVFLLQVIFLAF